jgi:hypothetical protein
LVAAFNHAPSVQRAASLTLGYSRSWVTIAATPFSGMPFGVMEKRLI